MKNAKRFLLLLIAGILVIPLVNSCKVGDEDPDFSIYTRKIRLCQNWSFSYYKHAVQHNDTITSDEFDGSSYIHVYGTQSFISNAMMTISFNKKGTYTWDEHISNDTSVYTYKEEGYWYFTGGGKESETKFRELLALQKNSHVKTTQINGVTTTENYTASGNPETIVYKLIKLSKDEVKMESKVEKQYIQGGNTILDVYTTIINLKMGAK
ncbi:MAG TPA: hypothetical protein PKW80_08225 [Bacteroidales bacterium]|nr:hypothetical protein [Bacteroidales bacterium]